MSKVYQTVLYFVLGLSVLFSLFLVASDNKAPFTTQAQLHIPTSRIASEVSGVVTELTVKNGQLVKKGEILMKIDPTRYQLALEQAEASLNEAEQNFQAQQHQLKVTQAMLIQLENTTENAEKKFERNQSLRKTNVISQEQLDDSRISVISHQQDLASARASVEQSKAQLEKSGEHGALASARARVKLAQLDLEKTTLIAPIDGVISGLNLDTGTFVNANTPMLFIVDRDEAWINADFNEKGVTKLRQGTQVRVVFDALPGEVFTGIIRGKEHAIYDASSDNNNLANVTNDDRWIRENQKVRTQVVLPQLSSDLFSGSKASVMVSSKDPIWNTLSNMWIELLAYIRYLI